MWATGRDPDAEDRTLELHRMLTERKPFEEQLRVAKCRSESLRKQDVDFGRAHKEAIAEVQQRLDEAARENRQKTIDGIREANRMRAASEGVLADRMREQQESYTSQKKEMEERVKGLPKLCGAPPTRETAERREQRTSNRQAMKLQTRQYFEERRALQEKFEERPKRSFSQGAVGRPKDEVIEEKKADGLSALAKTGRDYEAQLEDLYSKHQKRVRAERRQREEDFQAHLDHRLAASDELFARRSALQEKIRSEAAEREERRQSRAKGFHGYSPKAKSERRLREEAARAKLAGATTSGGGAGGGFRSTA